MASSMLIGILITFLVIILVLYLVQRLPLDARMRQIVQVIDAGANGYILKSSPEDEILRAVNRVMAGETYLPSVLPHAPDAKSTWTPPEVSLKAEKVADLHRLPVGVRDQPACRD